MLREFLYFFRIIVKATDKSNDETFVFLELCGMSCFQNAGHLRINQQMELFGRLEKDLSNR